MTFDQTASGPGDLVDLLTSCQRAASKGLASLFEDEGVTVDQWRLMRTIAGEGRTMGDLAAALEIPHPTLTRLVDGLAGSACVYRAQTSDDRRRVTVHLSQRGAQTLSRLNAQAAAHENALRGQLGDRAVDDLTGALMAFRTMDQADNLH